ncbi:MAG: sugar phosphate isomerase/epimerase [Dehalococcoidia bacterium]
MTRVTAEDALPLPALSTMWAMQPRFQHDLHAFLERAAELGYGGVEINHSMDAQMAGAILASGVLPVTSVHAPAPLERHATAGWNRELNLASTDETERALAVQYTTRTIDLAAEAGARFVVVHLGGIAARILPGERRLRELWPRRDLAREEWDARLDEAVRERAGLIEPYLGPARRSFDELVEYAGPRGVAIGLECRLHYHEIPSPTEVAELIAPYPASVAGYWHDVGHAEVQHRLGLVDRSAWFDLLGERLLGTHLHDVRGLVDHRAPGAGDVDYAWLAARVAPSAARTLEIDQHEPDESVARALDVLRGANLL